MIARKLIEQAIKAKNITITARRHRRGDRARRPVDGRHHPRELAAHPAQGAGISPVQYARDIIYPALALRRLAEPGVVVTDQEYKEAFATAYGEKLRCRIILVSKTRDGKDIWDLLKKDPDSFERIARNDNRSIDQGTKALGGMLGEPLRRHAMPRTVSDAAFHDLVDGDPTDKNPETARKPKDGDISGLIQVSETSWVIIKRESLEPADARRTPRTPSSRPGSWTWSGGEAQG